MSNIWDGFEGGADFVDGFPVPEIAQFPDPEDFDEDTPKAKFSVKNHDLELRSIRGTKNITDHAGDTASVINIRVAGVNGDFDGTGEPDSYWFKEANFDEATNNYHMIAKKQAVGIAKLLEGAGKVTPDSYGEFVAATATPAEWMAMVNMLIDAAGSYSTGNYVFKGTVEWERKWNAKHSKAFTNVRLYVNACPPTELPF